MLKEFTNYGDRVWNGIILEWKFYIEIIFDIVYCSAVAEQYQILFFSIFQN